jgi:hypothetical protein
MSKSKKKEPPVPDKTQRTYTMPTEHLALIADRILTTAPTKVIILNTLKEVWKDGRDVGYFSRLRESRNFKDKRENIIKETFDALQDKIDDVIHCKNQNNS